jgi:hypothetical protein
MYIKGPPPLPAQLYTTSHGIIHEEGETLEDIILYIVLRSLQFRATIFIKKKFLESSACDSNFWCPVNLKRLPATQDYNKKIVDWAL